MSKESKNNLIKELEKTVSEFKALQEDRKRLLEKIEKSKELIKNTRNR